MLPSISMSSVYNVYEVLQNYFRYMQFFKFLSLSLSLSLSLFLSCSQITKWLILAPFYNARFTTYQLLSYSGHAIYLSISLSRKLHKMSYKLCIIKDSTFQVSYTNIESVGQDPQELLLKVHEFNLAPENDPGLFKLYII